MMLPFKPATLPAILPSLSENPALARDGTVHVESFLTKDAEAGNAGARFILGEMYAAGLAVRRDCARALHWLGKAAEQKKSGAQFTLGEMHGEGQCVPQDSKAAKAWFGKACGGGAQEGCAGARGLEEAGF